MRLKRIISFAVRLCSVHFFCFVFSIALIFSTENLQAEEVTPAVAKTVGSNFIKSSRNDAILTDSLVRIIDIPFDVNDKFTGSRKDKLYIFNIAPSGGFIVISGDDRVKPVLAYSLKSSIDLTDLPPGFQEWLQNYSLQIEGAVDNQIVPSQGTEDEWDAYKNGRKANRLKSSATVNPLIQTSWNQGEYYNEYCPYDESEEKRTYTGCVATAMAQLMKYWNHPAQGQGSNSYNHSTYGLQSADFGAASYNWSAMPSSLSSSNHEVATLMYHCGVSVNMDYGTDGSGASSNDIVYSMADHFRYSGDITRIRRSNYTDEQWSDVILSELYAERPIYYAGQGPDGGHGFICDGYNGSYFHFNWGWGGYADGWFSVDNLNPESFTFNDGQMIIYQIHPDGYVEQPVLSVNPSSRNVSYTGGSVEFSVTNNGTGTLEWNAAVSEGGSWARINSGADGVNSGTINISYDENNAGARTVKIIVSADGADGSPKELSLVQDAAPGPPDLFIRYNNIYTQSLNPGDIFSAEIEWGNQGETSSQPGKIKYVLSRDNIISEDDISLEEDAPSTAWEPGYSQVFDFSDLRIPASIEPGQWFFIIGLDCNDEVEEGLEDNNIAAAAISVEETGFPDIYIENLVLSDLVLEPGGLFGVECQLGNKGTVEMAASHFRIVISDDNSFSGDDYQLLYEEMGSLASGYNNPGFNIDDLALPESIGIGDWHLIMILDCDNEVDEDNEMNNESLAEFSLALSDLHVNIQSIHTSSLIPGEYIRADIEWGNQGGLSSSPGNIMYYLSQDNIVSNDDIELGEENPGTSWPADYSLVFELNNLMIPEYVGPGDWHFIIVMDNDQEIKEENENNNTSSALIEIKEIKKADIIALDLLLKPNGVTPGGSLEASFEIVNRGDADMPACHYRCVLSEDDEYSTEDYLVEYGQLDPLAAGSGSQLRIDKFSLSESIDFGYWYIIVQLDCENEVAEKNEYNNKAVAGLNVTLPDLYSDIRNIYTPSLYAGEFLRFDVKWGNLGGAGSSPGKFKYIMSMDNLISSDDIILLEGVPNENNWVSGYLKVNLVSDLRIPEDAEAGEWNIIVSLDSDNEIDENDESNNISSSIFNVLPNDPILSVSSDNIIISYESDEANLDIINSGTGILVWEASVTEGNDWLEIAGGENNGVNDQSITFIFSENPDCMSRTGQVRIEGNGAEGSPMDILITQGSDPFKMPDLHISDLKTEFSENMDISIEAEVVNSGECESGNTRIDFFICEDETADSKLDFLGSLECNQLSSLDNYINHLNTSLAGIDDGMYFLLAEIDTDNTVPELDEENNHMFQQISINSTGVEIFEKSLSVSIYPNPADSWINISMIGSLQQDCIISAFDNLGRKVKEFHYKDILPFNNRINIEDLNTGIYTIVIDVGKGRLYRKLVVR